MDSDDGAPVLTSVGRRHAAGPGRQAELIAALSRSGVTIFLTTHRLEEAERLCDRVAIHQVPS